MEKEEIIKSLNDCYLLRNRFKQLNVETPEELEKNILRYESMFRIVTVRKHDFHHVVEPNDRAFYDSLVEYLPEDSDRVWLIAADDAWIPSAAIIYHGGKYGVFYIPGYNPNYGDCKYFSVAHPFIYEDVRVAPNFSVKNNIGLIALKKNSKWGVLDMHKDYCFQTIVDFDQDDIYGLPAMIENKTGYLFEDSWRKLDLEAD